MSPACTDVVRKAINVAWVAHEDGDFDGVESGAGEGLACTAAHGIVHDLTALVCISILNLLPRRRYLSAYLGVTNKNDLSRRAPLVKRSNSPHDCSRSLSLRAIVAGTAAVGLSAAGWVDDGLGGAAGEGGEGLVHEAACGSITRRDGSFTGAEDVDFRAGLTFLDVDRVCGDEAGKENRCS